MEKSNSAHNLTLHINHILQYDKESLIKNPKWGAITFENSRKNIDRVFDIVNFLNVLPYEYLPDAIIDSINLALIDIINEFRKIKTYDIQLSNHIATKDTIIANIDSYAQELLKSTATWIPFLAYQRGDTSKKIDALSASVRDAQGMVETAKTNISQKQKEIDEMTEKARETSAAAVAAVFTKDYQTESAELKTTADNWLNHTKRLGIATIVVAIAFILIDLGSSGISWTRLGTKLTILGFMISGTFWCGRIYKALMHQSTIYKHRALSIQTIQAFKNAAIDDQTKDAVLHEAAKAVFGNTATGYIDQKGSGHEMDFKVIEVVKSFMPKQK